MEIDDSAQRLRGRSRSESDTGHEFQFSNNSNGEFNLRIFAEISSDQNPAGL